MADFLCDLRQSGRLRAREIRLRAPRDTALDNPILRRDADHLLRDNIRGAGVYEEAGAVQSEWAVHGAQLLSHGHQWGAAGAVSGATDSDGGAEWCVLCHL